MMKDQQKFCSNFFKSLAPGRDLPRSGLTPPHARGAAGGKIVLFFVIVMSALVMVSCFLYAKIEMIPLYIGKEKFTVEIADTHEKQLLGLMYRKSVPDDFGMLFVYGNEELRGFWMKNCFVHLDLVFINRDKQVVDIIHNVPPCESEPCETYMSDKPAMYILELRGGRAKELNLEIGASIFFVLK